MAYVTTLHYNSKCVCVWCPFQIVMLNKKQCGVQVLVCWGHQFWQITGPRWSIDCWWLVGAGGLTKNKLKNNKKTQTKKMLVTFFGCYIISGPEILRRLSKVQVGEIKFMAQTTIFHWSQQLTINWWFGARWWFGIRKGLP